MFYASTLHILAIQGTAMDHCLRLRDSVLPPTLATLMISTSSGINCSHPIAISSVILAISEKTISKLLSKTTKHYLMIRSTLTPYTELSELLLSMPSLGLSITEFLLIASEVQRTSSFPLFLSFVGSTTSLNT